MKHIFQKGSIAILLIFFASLSFGQKLGYLNSTVLLNEHPEIKVANTELETLQKQLSAKIQKKLEGLQVKYDDLARKEKQGEISPKQLSEEANKLREEEMQLQQEEQGMQQQLLQKREELYQPILDKIQEAIDAVAEENGYTYIFDASAGVLLYAAEGQDVSDLVKAKLGI